MAPAGSSRRPRTASTAEGVAAGGPGVRRPGGGVVGRVRGASEARVSGGRGDPKRPREAGAGSVSVGTRARGTVAVTSGKGRVKIAPGAVLGAG